MAQQTSVGVFSATTDLSGRVTWCCRGVEAVLGRPRADIVGTMFPLGMFDRRREDGLAVASGRDDLVERRRARPAADRRRTQGPDLGSLDRRGRSQLSSRASTTPPSRSSFEESASSWSVTLADGTTRTFSIAVLPMRESDDVVTGYLVQAVDASQDRETRDLLAAALVREQGAVRRLELLDAQRSTFVATASHELRTPVASILGYTELLADGEGGELNGVQRGLLDRVERNGRRLLNLIEDLLSLTRIDSDIVDIVTTEVDVETLVAHVWEAMRPHLRGRTLTTGVELPRDVGCISGDLRQLERALLNLLTNAIKFTPDGGTVRLTVESTQSGVDFVVTDTGQGISEDDLTAVFEPFFRTREAHVNAVPGSGIGLTVVQRIVRCHGGRVELESRLGGGTTARVSLPRDRG